MAQAASYPTKSPVVSGDKLLLLDSAASNAIKQASVADVAQQAAGGVSVPKSSGAALFALDSSVYGNNVTLANGGQVTPFGSSANFSGLIVVNELTATGNVGLFIAGGLGGVAMVGSNDASLFAVSDTAGKLCVFFYTGFVLIKNNTGGSRTIGITGFRVRAA